MSKKLYIIVGPTSSGKTSLALDLATRMNGEVISADSRQLYKHMDIGTGKVPVNFSKSTSLSIIKNFDHWIINGIKVWGYDLAGPNDFYSAYDFAKFSLEKAHEIIEQGKNVFLVGGTGFYIDLFTGIIKPAEIEPNFELRKSLELKTLSELQTNLMSLNIDAFNKIDKANKVRLIRAIEKLSSPKKISVPLPYFVDFDYVYIGLKSENKFLYDRVDTWLDTIWENGLLDEVKKLISLGFKNSPKLQGLIYKSVLDYLHNHTEVDLIKQKIKYDLHSYIRRQLTYFKKNKNINWFDISTGDYIENIYNLING